MKRALLLLLLILEWSASALNVLADEPLKIGVIVPLTGPLAVWGEDAQKTFRVFDEFIPTLGFKHRYKLILEDGQCGVGNAAVTSAKKLIHIEKVKFLITACSGEILQVGPIAQREGVVAFAFLASHPDIKKLGDYIFRTFLDMERGTDMIAELMKKEGRKRIALVTEESSFTAAIGTRLRKIFGEQIIVSADFLPTDEDHRTLLQKIKAAKPDALYLNVATPRTYIHMIKALNEVRIKLPIYSYHQPSDRDALTALGTMQDGVQFFGMPHRVSHSPVFQRFHALFLERYPHGATTEYIERTAFDATYATLLGIEHAGYNPAAVKEFLSTMKFDGAMGDVEFDENGDIKNIPWELIRIEAGKPVTLP